MDLIGFDANEWATQADAGNPRAARPHKWIDHQATSPTHEPGHQPDWFFGWMPPVATYRTLHNVAGAPDREVVIDPRVEQHELGLATMLVRQIAHRPVGFNPRDAAAWHRHVRHVIPAAENVFRVFRVNPAGKAQQIARFVAFNCGIFDASFSRPKRHTVGWICDHSVSPPPQDLATPLGSRRDIGLPSRFPPSRRRPRRDVRPPRYLEQPLGQSWRRALALGLAKLWSIVPVAGPDVATR